MIHSRVKIMCEIEVNLDSVPGWGTVPTDFVNSLRSMVTQSWSHYHPTVTVDHTEPMFMVTHGGPEDEQTWVFVDEQEAVAKQQELLAPLLESLKKEN